MKKTLATSLFLLTFFCASGQSYYKVKAEKGDGIFSILRKEGLNPSKYYAEFIALNKANLINGSELHFGREYLIPNAPDSFKKTAVEVQTEEKQETSIFNTELAGISSKSSLLKNAVIYLISGNNPENTSEAAQQVAQEINYSLAQELMVHGAQVYFIQSDAKKSVLKMESEDDKVTEGAMGDLKQIQDYVEVINKKYLQHHGKYQRILITRVNDDVVNKYCEVSVYHHLASEEGKNIAGKIQRLFSQNSIANKPKEYTDTFRDKNNLYLAKNALPAITLIDIDNGEGNNISTIAKVKSDRAFLSNLIANGVLNDYTDLAIEN